MVSDPDGDTELKLMAKENSNADAEDDLKYNLKLVDVRPQGNLLSLDVSQFIRDGKKPLDMAMEVDARQDAVRYINASRAAKLND